MPDFENLFLIVEKSFNQKIRDTICSEAKKLGHEIALINLLPQPGVDSFDKVPEPTYSISASAIRFDDTLFEAFMSRGCILYTSDSEDE